MRRLLAVLVVTVAGALALPALASAGSYVDFECQSPTGAPGPANGFTPDSTVKAEAARTCGSLDGSLAAGLTGSSPWPAGQGAVWGFGAPSGTFVSGVAVSRQTAGVPNGGASGLLGYRIYTDQGQLDGCSGTSCAGDVNGVVSRSGLAAKSLVMSIACGGNYPDFCTSAGANLRLSVPRAVITLQDDSAPVPAKVGGTLLTPGAKRGIQTISFDASDVGGGLYRVIINIDGKAFDIQAVALAPCVDANPAGGTPYEFQAKQPCPLSVAGFTTPIDTNRLSEGNHTAEVLIEDAAGNRSIVVGPAFRFSVQRGNPNGSPASVDGRVVAYFANSKTRRTRGTIRVNTRTVIRGRLTTPRGRGIVGAKLDVTHWLGKKRLNKTGVKTRKRGLFTYIIPKGMWGPDGKRRVAIYYRAFRPGKVTSRANIFLTVRRLNGRLQTTAPRGTPLR